MTVVDECDHGSIPNACPVGDCTNSPAIPEDEDLFSDAIEHYGFVLRFDDNCDSCGGFMPEGSSAEMIIADRDHNSALVHLVGECP